MKLIKSIASCLLIPIQIDGEDESIENNTFEIRTEAKTQIGSLELYFNDPLSRFDPTKLEEERNFLTLFPIFSLLRDILSHEKDSEKEKEEIKEIDVSKIENENIDESRVSISASFLEANKKTSKDSLLAFTQATKHQCSFSQLLNHISNEIPKILSCDKSLLILLVETSSTNMFGAS